MIHQASLLLTDADIQGLPGAPQQLAGNPGANRQIVPVFVTWIASIVDAYTGFADGDALVLSLGGLSTIMPVEDTSDTALALTSLLGVPGDGSVTIGGDGYYSVIYSQFNSRNRFADTSFVDTPLMINGFSGAGFVGGNPSNTLRSICVFCVLDRTTGLFLTTAQSGWNQTTRTFA